MLYRWYNIAALAGWSCLSRSGGPEASARLSISEKNRETKNTFCFEQCFFFFSHWCKPIHNNWCKYDPRLAGLIILVCIYYRPVDASCILEMIPLTLDWKVENIQTRRTQCKDRNVYCFIMKTVTENDADDDIPRRQLFKRCAKHIATAAVGGEEFRV